MQSRTSNVWAQATPEYVNFAVMDQLLEATSEGFLVDLVEVFTEESTGRIERIEQAIALNNLQLLEVEVHSLKGTSATIGAMVLKELSEQVELAARRSDISTAFGLARYIIPQVQNVLLSLNEFVQLRAIKP